jgi:exodeoxyribonuclease VII large subunit
VELRAYVRGLSAALTATLQGDIEERRWKLSEQARTLVHLSPTVKLVQSRQRLDDLIGRAETELRHGLILRRERLDGLVGRLMGVSPLGTLERGYAIVRRQETEAVIRSVEQVASGDVLSVYVADGEFEAEVT